ncbi:phage tail sheath subtilisin-like domain-containing protein [Meridianimarinicoccus sp. RP-17]|uniref:phage tail sheath subtilisin-like domain-containing protein n=1 Tax=Meridianimarinicoccus zhengii TaxID=2056810 RepID=UPI000DADDB1E|nr:phage tail sheath subtilisin-like domain-containing protein [Phycocomes zhengii]
MFLHGVETIEKDDGLRPIPLLDTSTIGIVGVAPDAAPATAASLTLGVGNAAVTLTAATAGTAGNAITIDLVDPGAASAAASIDVTDSAIRVSLATDTESAITTTPMQLIGLIEGEPDAGALVAATLPTGSTGTLPLRRTLAPRPLAGGAAEPFPLNTPVLVTSRAEAAPLGYIPYAKPIDGIFDQAGARIVIVRVAEGADTAETLANVIGGVDGAGNNTGIQALLDARANTGVVPKILICPGFTNNVAVTAELIAVADRLRAIVIADGPNTTDAQAIQFRDNFGSQRLMVVDPWVTVFDPVVQTEVADPPSSRVAGIIARTDAERGFWWSPSNKLMNGITGTTRPVSFALNDPNTRANLLNAAEVTTIVQDRGWRLWGNRGTSADQLWAFLSVRRTADAIEESIEAAQLWAMDRPFSAQLLRDIRDSVAAFLRTLQAQGAILGGTCWLDPELNTEATLKAGQLFVNYDFEPPAPLERLTFHAYRNGDYYSDLIAEATSAT